MNTGLEQKIILLPIRLVLIFLAAALLFSGCHSAVSPDITDTVILEGDFDRLWRISQDELKGRLFSLGIVDRRSGLIETLPRTSGQWFEFWCQDVVTFDAFAQSNLQTVRRTVSLQTEDLGVDRYRLNCRVNLEIFDSGPRLVAGTVRATEILQRAARGLSNSPEPLANTGGNTRWLTLGSDPELQSHILSSIEKSFHCSRK